MKKLALRGALSARASEGNIKVVETIDWATPKTKSASSLLAAIGATRKALVVLGPTDRVAERSFRNLPNVVLTHSGQLSAYDVLWADTVLFTTDTLGSVAAGSYDVSDSDFVQEASPASSDLPSVPEVPKNDEAGQAAPSSSAETGDSIQFDAVGFEEEGEQS